ncbi:LysR family transcriptional regulator [Hyalangium versicolor]|uniref:LysR family transcriptional regulator n=1 Tax=Hyalangium versicolor TaxID=2861190 RepID=UPI001CCC8351|nr:LysR family transcriptional regulator [Hyalangium versicolor]
MIDDFGGISCFVALAETRSFRAAGDRLGVTRSAISQALQRLEDRLGVALVQRTTRSVSLTEAGERLFESVRPALADVSAAMEAVGESQSRPNGTLRLSVSSIAETFLTGPSLAGFLAAYPELRLDISVSDEACDIVAEGFDAGVRLGEVIEQDMIAVPVSEPQRQLVVGAPSYVKRRGTPKHPRELPSHDCIGWRRNPRVAPYRWEFTERGRDFDVAVNPRVTTDEMSLMVRLACAGAGLTFGMEETFRPYLARGELVTMLEPFSPPFPGFFLFYPNRRNPPLKLRVLVEYLRRRRSAR